MMDTKPDKDNTRIALIDNNVGYIQKDIAEIKQSIKELAGVYVTQAALKENTDRIIALEKTSNIWKFLSPTFAAIAGSVFTFLLYSFLNSR